MANRDIVVVGASAGGVEALTALVTHMPRDLESAIFIAWHSAPYTHSILPAILARAGELPVAHAIHGEPVQHGKVYVAPPDHHLMLEDERVRLTRGPRENRFRPAVDPLFRSAAYTHGPRVVGVVMSGGLDDGTAGLWAIKDRGGKAIVQEPTEARHPSMPLSALQHVEVDYRLPAAQIGAMLVTLSKEAAGDEAQYPISDQLEIETRIASRGRALEAGALKLGQLSAFTCPECRGTLLQIKDGSIVRFRCHTGHAYSADALLASLSQTSEDALWSAVRAIEESAILLQHMGEHATRSGNAELAASLKKEAEEAQQRADAVRSVATQAESPVRDLEQDRETASKPAGRRQRSASR